jgi:hypothetical protein
MSHREIATGPTAATVVLVIDDCFDRRFIATDFAVIMSKARRSLENSRS